MKVKFNVVCATNADILWHYVCYRLSSSNYAFSSTPTHYSSVSCDGSETGIVNCTKSVITPSDHTSDVFIVCWPANEIYTGKTIA